MSSGVLRPVPTILTGKRLNMEPSSRIYRICGIYRGFKVIKITVNKTIKGWVEFIDNGEGVDLFCFACFACFSQRGVASSLAPRVIWPNLVKGKLVIISRTPIPSPPLGSARSVTRAYSSARLFSKDTLEVPSKLQSSS